MLMNNARAMMNSSSRSSSRPVRARHVSFVVKKGFDIAEQEGRKTGGGREMGVTDTAIGIRTQENALKAESPDTFDRMVSLSGKERERRGFLAPLLGVGRRKERSLGVG